LAALRRAVATRGWRPIVRLHRRTVTVLSGGNDVARSVQIGLWGDRRTEIWSGLDEDQTVLVSQAG
jgi:hypothetical protein